MDNPNNAGPPPDGPNSYPTRNLPGGALGARAVLSGGGSAAESIFVLVKQQESRKSTIVGSGFYIHPLGIFVTARHVAADVILEGSDIQKTPLAIVQITNGGYAIRSVSHVFLGPRNWDVAIGVAAQMQDPNGNPLIVKALRLTARPLTLGEQILSVAYPDSLILNAESEERIYVNTGIYRGTVTQIYPDGRDGTMLSNPCYETNMHVHPGASGGPVFDSNGFVCGINSTSFAPWTDCSFVSAINSILELRVPGILSQELGPLPRIIDLVMKGYVMFGSKNDGGLDI